jgi:CrcB protein
MKVYLLVALGGALGSIARYWCSGIVARLIGETFPWGTITVNVLGSFIIGLFFTLTAPDGRLFVPSEWRAFVMLGFCGGFTTFSSFSLQTLSLLRDEEWLLASGNVAVSAAACLTAVWAGHVTALAFNELKR